MKYTFYISLIVITTSLFLSAETDDKPYEYVKILALSINKHAPYTESGNIRLDKAEALKPSTLIYYYTIINTKKSEINPGLFIAIEKRETLNRLIKEAELISIYTENKITIVKYYKLEDNTEIGVFTIYPEEYIPQKTQIPTEE
jgi:hypothetical protein